jgi:signal transduction histidine kinase
MGRPPLKILVVDDDEDDFVMLRDMLLEVQGASFHLDWAPSYEQGRERLAAGAHDLAVVDYRLGPQTGLDLLRAARQAGIATPLILLTGYGEHEVDLEAMRLGAADYLVKDQVSPYLLERAIRYAIHHARSLEALKEREAQILVQDRLASVGLLASSLAHEIGTPLGVIRGRAEYLSLKLQGDEAVQKNATVIIQQIDRVAKLIRSLLNLARGDAKGTAGRVSLPEVAGEVVELMAHDLERKGIQLRDGLASRPEACVAAESGPLHQVLLNLLVNSVHAIESAKALGRADGHFIALELEESESAWVLGVRDSGCGISRENLRHLFKPFFTTKDIGVGTGLGLATSYRIVESWGGKVEVESKEGAGALFRLTLPKPAG